MKKYLYSLVFLVLFATPVLHAQTQGPVLWGLTANGGDYDGGTIITYDVHTQTTTVWYSLNPNYGQAPYADFFKASNGLLYFMPSTGGNGNEGTFSSYNITTGTYRDIVDMGTGSTGLAEANHGYGNVIEVGDSTLYGVTENGGAVFGSLGEGSGMIFSYNIYTGQSQDLHDFGNDSDGLYPTGSLFQASNGLLYGLAQNGGTYNLANYGDGTIYSYNPANGAYNTLYYFGAPGDGAMPLGTFMQATDTLLYGMTQHGGQYDSSGTGNGGTIFTYNPVNGNYNIVHSFGSAGDGYWPWGNLIQVGDSLLYGMAENGGVYHNGIIFSYNIYTGIYSNLYSFGSDSTDGRFPLGSLFKASDGLLYGMTSSGGTVRTLSDSSGTIFSYNIATGVETVLHSFTGGYDGAHPYGSFIEVDQLPTSWPEAVKQIAPASGNARVYPNPSNGLFTIQLPAGQNTGTAEVFDVLGNRVMQNITLSGSAPTINLGSQAAGMYYLSIKFADESIATGKLVISR